MLIFIDQSAQTLQLLLKILAGTKNEALLDILEALSRQEVEGTTDENLENVFKLHKVCLFWVQKRNL